MSFILTAVLVLGLTGLVLGLVLFIWPGKTLTLAARILGIALLVGAAVSGFSWYREKDRSGASYTSLAIAILCLVAGLIVLIAVRFSASRRVEAAEVSAIGNPVVIKKDTIEYNAGAFLSTDNDNLVDLLKKMQQAGYIERTRSERDDRVVVITLTESGKALREQAKDVPKKVASCLALPPAAGR